MTFDGSECFSGAAMANERLGCFLRHALGLESLEVAPPQSAAIAVVSLLVSGPRLPTGLRGPAAS